MDGIASSAVQTFGLAGKGKDEQKKKTEKRLAKAKAIRPSKKNKGQLVYEYVRLFVFLRIGCDQISNFITHARTHAQNNTLYTKLDWLIVRLEADRCHYYLSKKVKYHGCVVCQDTSCS